MKNRLFVFKKDEQVQGIKQRSEKEMDIDEQEARTRKENKEWFHTEPKTTMGLLRH